MKKISILATLILFVLTSTHSTQAAGEVDPSFTGSIMSPGVNAIYRVNVLVVQPDGKVLAGGIFRLVGGLARDGLVRLNADGTVDASFVPPEFVNGNSPGGTINRIALQSDGKILVGGAFQSASGVARQGILRLNANGSIDMSFTSPLNNGGTVADIIVAPDNRIYIGGSFTINDPNGNRPGFTRLNTDGTLDSIQYQNINTSITRLLLLDDGRLLAGSTTNIRRFNTDGAFDPTFATLTTNGSVLDMHLQGDGKAIVTGSFTTINGSNQRGPFRLNTDGTVDATFNSGQTGANFGATGITPVAGGKYLIYGGFTIYNGVTRNRNALINSDGSLDPSFNYLATGFGSIFDVAALPDGRFLYAGFSSTFPTVNSLARVNADGTNDSSFFVPVGIAGAAYTVLVQPDGKIVVGGNFPWANNANHGCLLRFNPDGTTDTSFVQQFFQLSSALYNLELTFDGKILVAHWNGSANAARFNSNGTTDIVYQDTSRTYDVKPLPDGKALIAYSNGIDRYNIDGLRDNTFTRVSLSSGGSIYKMAIQPDGKIVAVGTFTTVSGQSRGRIVRANADGTIDNTFNPPGGANGNINTVLIQPDGKIVIGGDFTGVNFDLSKKYLARLNSDGSLDTSFSPVLNAPILGLKMSGNNKIFITGSMSVVNTSFRAGIARINLDGTVDTGFDVGTGTNSTVWDVDQQADGKVVYVGQFSKTNGFTTAGIGRLFNQAAPNRTPFDYDGDAKADISVFRPSENKWYIFRSSDMVVSQTVFAVAGDVPVPADYDGDLKTDIAIYRPSSGAWWYLSSQNGAQINANWGGEAGDIPRPSDFNGDGKTDFVIFRPTNSTWYRITSTGTVSNVAFGLSGDKPVIGDFDGDGKSDVAIYRPSTGDWWYQSSINNAQLAVRWGISTDTPAPADFDGDGKTDFAVFRPSTGVWYVINSSNGSFLIGPFGISEDKPVPADYDGDGKAELAVFRPSTGIWYQLRTNGGFFAMQFGISTDTPTPNSFVP